MYLIRIQSIATILDETEHRFKTVVSQVQLRTARTEQEAVGIAYNTFIENEGIDAMYATISVNGRFVRPIKFGSLDGFKIPGPQERHA